MVGFVCWWHAPPSVLHGASSGIALACCVCLTAGSRYRHKRGGDATGGKRDSPSLPPTFVLLDRGRTF